MALLTWKDVGVVVKLRARDASGMKERAGREVVRERRPRKEQDEGRMMAARTS